ncbi:MAG: hypothetical protein IPM82_09835 [Saprospiraceae bacterium]|nr:hypothetical protein [Saprospiraceae bacterium]
MQKNKKLTEIINTLEQIDKANKMLAFHRQFEQPDMNAVANFVRLREDFLRQLAILLKDFEVEVKLPIAA